MVPVNARCQPRANHHPTCKPALLMEYLIALACPQGGTVLDPFIGSGTTGVAAKRLGRRYVGIELNAEYCRIAEARIAARGEAPPPADPEEQLLLDWS